MVSTSIGSTGTITLLDQPSALAGGRLMPRGVLAPRMTPSRPPGSGAFAATLDARLVGEPTPERAVVEMHVTEAHLNANGIVHGGVMMTLLDMAMATSVTRSLAPEERTASINIQTNFLKAASPGRLVATGRLLRRGRTVAFPEGELTDGEGNVLARATGIWAITPKR